MSFFTKVTLKVISNNWSITNQQAKEVLAKWTSSNIKSGKDYQVEYLICGKNSKGILSFSVVSEEKKKLLEKKWTSFSSWIYSIEPRSNNRTLDIPNFDEIKVKNILLDGLSPRDVKLPILPPTNQEIKKPEPPKSKASTFFKPQVKQEVPEKKVSPVKIEKVVEEKKSSPEEKKPVVEQPKKNSKNQKSTQKGSISSFFNNKPNSSKTSVSSSSKSDDVEMKSKPIKREPSPEVVDVKEEPPKKKKIEQKKLKLKETSNNKRSRIRVMEDSSEEEEQDESEPETKLIKFDREITPEPQPVELKTEEKLPEKPSNGRRKAKRTVTKRYMTDEGFMRTEQVQEEYSASEDEHENDENKKKNSPEVKSSKKIETNSTEKKSAEKKKKSSTKPTQSSKITSFFTKK